MWAIPEQSKRVRSEWEWPVGSSQRYLAHEDSIPAVSSKHTDRLADPPWIQIDGAPSNPTLILDERTSPPTEGVEQRCTTIQLIGGGDEDYEVCIDGITCEPDVSLSGKYWLPRFHQLRTRQQDHPSGLVWRDVGTIPPPGTTRLVNAYLEATLVDRNVLSKEEWRKSGVAQLAVDLYVEVGGRYFVPDDTRRIAAPVCISASVGEGTEGPIRCTVRVRQRVIDHGTVVMEEQVQ